MGPVLAPLYLHRLPFSLALQHAVGRLQSAKLDRCFVARRLLLLQKHADDPGGRSCSHCSSLLNLLP